MNNASNFPKPSAIASAERGVIELIASNLGRRNIGSVVEIVDNGELHIGRMTSLIRENGYTNVYIEGQDIDEPLILTSKHKVLVSQDPAASRGFIIGDRTNRLLDELLTVFQLATRDHYIAINGEAPKLSIVA